MQPGHLSTQPIHTDKLEGVVRERLMSPQDEESEAREDLPEVTS